MEIALLIPASTGRLKKSCNDNQQPQMPQALGNTEITHEEYRCTEKDSFPVSGPVRYKVVGQGERGKWREGRRGRGEEREREGRKGGGERMDG